MKGILVTGGAGYLGTVLVPLLLQEGYPVKLLDRFYFGREPVKPFRNHPLLTIHDEDIFDHERIPSLMEGIDTVVHLAALSNDPSCDLDPPLSIRTNVTATISLAQRAKVEEVRHFIFASSCSVYGGTTKESPDEDAIPEPLTLYAKTKLEGARAVAELSSADFRVTRLRLPTLFGFSPRMRFDLAVNTMIKSALRNGEIVIHGHGRQCRPFLHVEDAALGVMAATKRSPDGEAHTIYNVGHDSLNFSIEEITTQIARYFPVVRIIREPNSNDTRSYRPDFSKFQSTFRLVPQRHISDAVSEIRTAYQEGRFGSMEDDRFYNVRVLRRWRQMSSNQHNSAWSHG